MKYIFRYIVIIIIFTYSCQSAGAYSLVTKKIDGYKVNIFHIPYDDIYGVTARASNSGTTLKSLISNTGESGLNGAYFLPRDYTKKDDETNTIRVVDHDGYSYSKYYPDTGINGLFGFLGDHTPILIQNNMYGSNAVRWNMNKNSLLEVESGIANFPIFLSDGTNLLPSYDQAGLITEKMKQKTHKSFICRTEENDIKMGVIEKINILNVPTILTKIKCKDAINLDNGESLTMIYKGKYIYGPGRPIMDGFIISKK